MILNFRSRVLQRFWRGDVRRIQPPAVAQRTGDILAALDAATRLSDVETLTGFHRLSGNRAHEYAVLVTRNWRITFTPIVEPATDPATGRMEEVFHVRDVDYEDYH